MDKIMFNDRYSLTQGVIDGRKTMTRRIVPKKVLKFQLSTPGFAIKESRYKVGEVVAVAQKYSEIEIPISGETRIYNEGLDLYQSKLEYEPGWTNKMFVKADLMPHQIRITNVRVERLQDISEEDCLREGIYKAEEHPGVPVRYAFDTIRDQDGNILATTWFTSARGAFAGLIDKVCGKGTWGDNPHVYVYTFENVK